MCGAVLCDKAKRWLADLPLDDVARLTALSTFSGILKSAKRLSAKRLPLFRPWTSANFLTPIPAAH
jgi:hypothetical protein